MNPEACLLAAESSIVDNESELAADALQNYAEWRRKFGFEPIISGRYVKQAIDVPGDIFHSQLLALYRRTFNSDPF